MRTECVRLATLPLGRPRLLHLSLSVSATRRSLDESDAPLFIRQGAQRRRRTHTLSHSLSHTHGRYCTHTLIHRAGRQHDFILQSGFSARYDGGEPPARSRGQNVSYSALLLVRQWRVGACVRVCCPEKQLSDVEMLLCYLMCDQNRGQNEGWSPCDCICVLLC